LAAVRGIGLVNSTLPFMLFAFAALHLPASYSVILNSTAPLFTALWAVTVARSSGSRGSS
jgi:drug/metabolite transporter (DMT)-like permease